MPAEASLKETAPPVAPPSKPDMATRGGWTADLVLLAALLGLTALIGRSFSKLAIVGTTIYVTEILIVLVLLFALRRCGFRGAIDRFRESVPLWPVLILWLAGAIATIRGLYLFGFDMVVHDVGLVEYSVMLALVPVVIDTRERAWALARVLFWAGLGAAFIYVGHRFLDKESIQNPGYALGIYISLFVFGVAALAVHRQNVRWYLFALGLVAMTAMSWLGVRAVWFALFAGILMLAAIAPRGRRVLAAVGLVTVFVLSNAGSIGLTEIEARISPPPLPPPPAPVADPDYIPDDEASRFTGGRTVQGDAAQGEISREIAREEYIELPTLTGLEIGRPYTVLFSVDPGGAPAEGRVGDTSGAGWGAKVWKAAPRNEWQPVKAVLRPHLTAERLVIILDEGARRVRVDEIRVVKGLVKGPSTDFEGPTPPATEQLYDSSITRPSIISETRGTFDPNVAGPANSNTEWRLAIWEFQLERAARQPVFGVGFGRPTNFRWRSGLGGLYDARTGAPSMQDVTGPHNSFVNFIFRTGLIGFVPLVILLVVATGRLWGMVRKRELVAADRALVAATAAIFVVIGVTASLSVALEGPYMGIFFWTGLAMLLTLPRLVRDAEPGQQEATEPSASGG